MKKILAGIGVLIIVAAGCVVCVVMNKTVTVATPETTNQAQAEVFRAAGTVNLSIQ